MGFKFNPLAGHLDLVNPSGTAAGGSYSAGISNLGNTLGITGMASNQIVFVGGNNVTLSQSLNGASATLTISAGNQTTLGSNVYMTGNTTLTSSGSLDATSLIMRADGLISLGISSNTVLFSSPASTIFQYTSNTSNITSNAMNSSERSNFIYSSAALNLTNISATLGSNAISLSVNPGGLQTGISGIAGSGASTVTQGTVQFGNANGISFGLNGSTMTASHNGLTQQSTQPVAASASNGSFNFSTLKFIESNGVTWATSTDGIRASVATNYQSQGAYLTTAMASDAGSRFLNVGTTNGTNISITLASNNLALSVANQSAQPVAASASNGSFNFSTLKFIETNGVTWATSTDGIRASVKTDYQSSNAGYLTSQSNQALSAANGSFTFQTATFANSNGISFSTGTQGIYASHNGITTARASNDAIGLNTAQTNVTWTANSSGLSINAAGYAGTGTSVSGGASITLNSNGLQFNGNALAGTGTTFNGTNLSASMTLNSAGLRLDMSAGAGGGVTPVASASNGSFQFTTIGFSNANNVTFGTSAGGIVTASVAAPGAAAENNWVNLLGANTAGNTTASGSTIGVSGINLTLSGTNGSVWNISAPATSSLSATGLVSLSTNGSTISIGVADKTLYMWRPYGLGLSSNTSIGVSSIYFCPINPQQNVSMGWVEQVWSNNISSSAAATWARSMTFKYGLYSLNGATISQISSSSVGMSMTASSNVSKAFTYGYGANTVTFSTATSSHPAWDVQKIVRLPFDMSMSAGGQYFWAQQISTASAGANVNASWSQLFNAEVTQASYALLEWTATSASTRFNILEPYGFIRSATSGGLPSSMATTDASIYSNYQPYLLFEKHT